MKKSTTTWRAKQKLFKKKNPPVSGYFTKRSIYQPKYKLILPNEVISLKPMTGSLAKFVESVSLLSHCVLCIEREATPK